MIRMGAIKIVGGTMYVYLKEGMKYPLFCFSERAETWQDAKHTAVCSDCTIPVNLPSFTQFKRFGLSGCRRDNLTLLQV